MARIGSRNAYYRAAGNGEVAEYMVDGIRLTTQDGRNWRGNVNPSAIAEITVLAGGLNAEYGNIGSIQIVTRDGGRDYHGQVPLPVYARATAALGEQCL